MANLSILRTIINNGWTIANRKTVVQKIGKNSFEEIIQLAKKVGRTGENTEYKQVESFLQTDTIAGTKETLLNSNVAYHGSPFLFDFFDIAKIGNGEGMNRYCKGVYLSRTKKIAPFYANIRSKDAPIHFGSTTPLEQTSPTVYTINNIDTLNLKLCTPIEAKRLKGIQSEFQCQHPEIDGIELMNGEITIFPESVYKLNISNRQNVLEFVRENKGYPFREWTTDVSKMGN